MINQVQDPIIRQIFEEQAGAIRALQSATVPGVDDPRTFTLEMMSRAEVTADRRKIRFYSRRVSLRRGEVVAVSPDFLTREFPYAGSATSIFGGGGGDTITITITNGNIYPTGWPVNGS